ncbi:hypothetical protein [Hymenobacter coccineus]|uniref:hypothetical protein n=1 Tax=Hymenobacter coccineus TaxID=1908235 RepID=UPI001EFB12BB|nr:hypothetical protein [Hymenobacter coccineus]
MAALAGVGGWRWLLTRPADEGTPWPFRRVLDANGRLSQAYFRETRLAPRFRSRWLPVARTATLAWKSPS